jgi:hypothetical protein
MWKLKELLIEREISVDEVDHFYVINVPQAQITIEARPVYCDRGNFLVKVFPRGDLALALDEQDGFPRYYFGPLACADEIHAWMVARKLL